MRSNYVINDNILTFKSPISLDIYNAVGIEANLKQIILVLDDFELRAGAPFTGVVKSITRIAESVEEV